MPRIQLWNPVKGNDYNFIDKTASSVFDMAGDGALIHLYEGPTIDSNGNTDTNILSIQDVLFLTNTNRKYNPDVIELRCHHTPQDVNFDLSQFGIMLSSDVIRLEFHYNDMMERIGRKLIAGDVIEFPSMRDVPIFNNAAGINKFYVVQEGMYSASSFGPKWYPHVWLVRAKLMTASVEFQEVIDQVAEGMTAGGQVSMTGLMPMEQDSPSNIKNSLDLFCQITKISEGVKQEAEQQVFFDPKFFESANLYIYLDSKGYPIISNYFSGDGSPPNGDTSLTPGGKLRGAGINFPEDMQDGEYYLRLDYNPERLFQKQGNCYKLIEVNLLKTWTSYNRLLDTFIDNINDTTLPDGSVVGEKQPLSSVVRQKVDLYSERKSQTKTAEKTRSQIADDRSAKRGY